MTDQELLEIKVDDSVVLRLQTHQNEDQEYQLIMDNYDYLNKWVFWVDDTFNKDTLHEGIERNLVNFREQQAYIMRAYVDGTLAGVVDVRDIVSGKSAEVGYWIAERFTGKGLASKSTLALMDYVRKQHGVHHFYLSTAADNASSARVAEKMGFHLASVGRNEQYDIEEKLYVKDYEG